VGVLVLTIILTYLVLPIAISTYNTLRSDFNSLNSIQKSESNTSTLAVPLAPQVKFDEQLLLLQLTQSFTNLSYNVTVLSQSDSYGYWPTYLLNGISNRGYWYQVGVAWNWAYYLGGHLSGFNFLYESFTREEKLIFLLPRIFQNRYIVDI
jgi:hypothetical protein